MVTLHSLRALHTLEKYHSLLLESFLHGFKVWLVSAILAIAYILQELSHSINFQIFSYTCLRKKYFFWLWFFVKRLICTFADLTGSMPLFVAYCAHLQFAKSMSHFSNLFLQKLHLVYERLGQKYLPCFFQFLPRSLLRICEKPSSWESSCDLGLEVWIIA